MNCLECGTELQGLRKSYCSDNCYRVYKNRLRGQQLREKNAKRKAELLKKTCIKCGAEYAPRHTSKHCEKCLYKRRRFERGDCVGCSKNLLIVNVAKSLCFTCNKKRLEGLRGPEWVAMRKAMQDQKTYHAREADKIWVKLRLQNEQGGGHCCECGAKKNSYNRSLYCEACKRAGNRLVLTLSEAANLV